MRIKIDREYVMDMGPAGVTSTPRLTGRSTLTVDNDIRTFGGPLLEINVNAIGDNDAIDRLAQLILKWHEEETSG